MAGALFTFFLAGSLISVLSDVIMRMQCLSQAAMYAYISPPKASAAVLRGTRAEIQTAGAAHERCPEGVV